MIFDLEALDSWSKHKLLTATVVPRPIAWVSTVDTAGIANIAPFAFFNVFGTEPPVVALGIHDSELGSSDTGANIRATRQFVVNLAPASRIRELEITSVAYPPEIDEFVEAGLTKVPSLRVTPPRVLESSASFECELVQDVQIGPKRWLAIGRVLLLHIIDEAVINAEACHIDSRALDLMARAQGGAYVRIGDTIPTPPIDHKERRAAAVARSALVADRARAEATETA